MYHNKVNLRLIRVQRLGNQALNVKWTIVAGTYIGSNKALFYISLFFLLHLFSYSFMYMYIYIFLNSQLPPVIKNMAFQKFSNMEQSLFTRFVRLCVPTVELDAQGRARSRYELFKPRLILSSNPGTSQCLSPGGREWKSFGRSHGFSGTGGGISHRQRSLKDGRTDRRKLTVN